MAGEVNKCCRGMLLLDSCVQSFPLATKARAIWKGPERCGQTKEEAKIVNISKMMELALGRPGKRGRI